MSRKTRRSSLDRLFRPRAVAVIGASRRAGVDEEALVDTILRVSRMACDHHGIAELEINPFLAFEDGILAVDMRVRVE